MSYRPKLVFVLTALAFAAVSPVKAQTAQASSPIKAKTTPDSCHVPIEAVANAADATAKTTAITDLLLPGHHQKCYAEIISEGAYFKSVIKSFEANRTDKQAGSSAGTGGSTNLVSKGATAQILSVAAEYGALTESVNNSTVTVQGSVSGLPGALIQQGFVPYCPASEQSRTGCLHQSLIDVLSRISYGVSFNTSQSAQSVTGSTSGSTSKGGAQQVTFSPSSNQISEVTAKISLFQTKENIASEQFHTDWQNSVKNLNDGDVATAFSNLWQNLIVPANASFGNWLDCAQGALQNAKPQQVEETWLSYADRLVKILDGTNVFTPPGSNPPCADVPTKDPSVKAIAAASQSNASIQEAAVAALRALATFEFNEQQFVDSLINKPVLTFEYEYNRPTAQPDISTFRLIYSQGWKTNWTATANGAFAIFNSASSSAIPGASRLADVQAAGELDRNFNLFGPDTVSIAEYFQYQSSPSIINVSPSNPLQGITFTGLPSTASQVFVQKGNINVVQLRLSVGVGQSSVKFPISITYSNRTELITKPEWNAQVGVTYDLDALFAGK
jgi:hypothetical protein